MINYTEFYNLVKNIYQYNTSDVVKAEWLKNIIADYLWPFFCLENFTPYSITPEGMVAIKYNKFKFSKRNCEYFEKYGIQIDDKNIYIHCKTSLEMIVGINKLKETILYIKDQI